MANIARRMMGILAYLQAKPAATCSSPMSGVYLGYLLLKAR